MPQAIEIASALLTLCGIAYGVIALLASRAFNRHQAKSLVPYSPPVTLLKPLKGADAHLYAGFLSHCAQNYPGPIEILFGVSSLQDPAVAQVARLIVEHPQLSIRLVECPATLGPNGKVSSLAQMLPHASFEHIVVNDSDILVSPDYLTRILAPFADSPFADRPSADRPSADRPSADRKVGLVTVPYIGRAERTLFSRLEALGISTDFMPGVLTARLLEGGIRFGLGSTLATTKSALASIGGFQSLAHTLADDYELGARLSAAGHRVELVHEVVATTVPAYTFRAFCDHQLRWARGTRDSRRAGYLGLGLTYTLPWAVATIIASGGSLWSFSLFSLALLVRVAVALNVGVGVLRDGQVIRDLPLLLLRDFFGLFFWAWSYAGNTVLWRGETFRLTRGRLERLA